MLQKKSEKESSNHFTCLDLYFKRFTQKTSTNSTVLRQSGTASTSKEPEVRTTITTTHQNSNIIKKF